VGGERRFKGIARFERDEPGTVTGVRARAANAGRTSAGLSATIVVHRPVNSRAVPPREASSRRTNG
jgi:hypothetical protein